MQNNKNPLFNRTKQCCDYSCKSSKPLSEKQEHCAEHCAVFSFFFFSVCNSGCAIIKPYSIWQDRVSQVVIFLYFWYGTFFDKRWRQSWLLPNAIDVTIFTWRVKD